jgi:dipeptidyl-peptidase-4
MKVLRFLFLIILFSKAGDLYSQVELTLPDIYKNGAYAQNRFGPIRWMKDGTGYSSIEKNKLIEGDDIVRYDALKGSRSLLVSAEELTPAGQTKPLTVADYHWSEDNSKLSIFTNTRKVWRYHTRGDYWVLDIQTRKLSQLGKGIPSSTLMFAKFSPDATRVAYVSKNNIFVESLDSGKITQLTTDGNDEIINGTFDWVYEEELDCRDGFRWSPDGKNISYWQSNTKGVGTFYLINKR